MLRRFRYSGEPYEDLFQVARMGLIKAAQRYDCEQRHLVRHLCYGYRRW